MAPEPISIGAALSALKKPLDDLYELAKTEGKQLIAKTSNKQRLDKLRAELQRIEIVKTLWNMERGVSLYDFYYQRSIQWDDKTKVRITSLDEIPSSGSCLIEGHVGQGKSIFLRYLCCQEIRKKTNVRIPIFIELRFLSQKNDLKSLIFDGFHKLGFQISDDLLKTYAASGQFVLLLDAFDEVDEKEVSSSIKYLDTLSSTFPALQIIVTSRPDSSLRGLALFRIIKLAPLTPAEYEPILRKIVKDDKLAKEIRLAIRKSTSGVRSLLTTPLLITLLVIVYRSSQTIPDNIADFYNKLFEVVFQRHDQTKAGFRRKFASLLSESSARKLFEAFCFCCLAKNASDLTADEFNNCTEIASQYTGIETEFDAFRHDIVSVASLLHEEGMRYHFIHRSVVEFFAASFVASSDGDFARDFYSKLKSSYFDWRQVAAFLQQIDRYKFAKFFGLNAIENWANHTGVADEVLHGRQANLSTLEKITGDWSVMIEVDQPSQSLKLSGIMFVDFTKIDAPRENHGGGLIEELVNRPLSSKVMSLVNTSGKRLYESAAAGELPVFTLKRQPVAFGATRGPDAHISVCNILSTLLDDAAINQWANSGLENIQSKYAEFQKAVNIEDRKSNMLDLIVAKRDGKPQLPTP